MKKILLVLLLMMGASCSNSKKDEAFLNAVRGFYTLDNESTTTEVIVNAEGDIYVGGVKVYDLEEVKTDTTAIYEHEIIKDYYGFSINGTKLSKTKMSYLTEKSVVFTDLEAFATKK